MGKAECERLNQALGSHLSTIHETLQVLDRTADSSLEKVKWEDVVKLGDQVSKQATVVGMLCTGGKPEVKDLEENMVSYFNVLQGFLLLSHGSTVGAGSTLSAIVNAAVKLVVDTSFKLWMDVVSSYGSSKKEGSVSVTVLVGAVWEACSALKKTPATNVIAIGRTMTQAALSIKDVLREMKELKLENGAVDELDNKSSNPEVNPSMDTGDSSDDELGNNLSVEEMQIAQSTINLVSQVLTLVKELIRSITGIVKQETSNSSGNNTLVDTLERLLKLCQCISLQVDELGASLYPPQELSTIITASEKISTCSDDIDSELQTLNCSSDSFHQCLNFLKTAIVQLHSDIKCSSPDACTSNLQNLTLSN